MARRRRFQFPSVHRKTWYFAFLIAGLGALMIIGAKLSPSDNFDGIYRVMAFNILLVGMLIINTVDRRREYRTMQLSKVRLLAYLFTFTTFWWAIFRQAPLAGGVPGSACSSDGIATMYPAGVSYAEPYTAFFWESCHPGYAELVNYHGAVAAGKCCIEVPRDTKMNCSSGLGLVPDIAVDSTILTGEGLDIYSECCPRMVGDIIPPGITTMLLSASLGTVGNILFNAFKRTPIWGAFRKHILNKIRHSDIVKRFKFAAKGVVSALLSCLSAWGACLCACITKPSSNTSDDDDADDAHAHGSRVDQGKMKRLSEFETADISDGDHGDVAQDDDGDSRTSDPEGHHHKSHRGNGGGTAGYTRNDAFLNYDASSPVMVMSADLPPELRDDADDNDAAGLAQSAAGNLNVSRTRARRATSTSNLQTCEYAFDRTVRSMLGVAAISSSPCGTFYAVTALHDDGRRQVGIYDVEQFKEQARPTVHFSLPDTLQIKHMVDVAISGNGRWLAAIHSGRHGWSLYLADDGTLLQSCELGAEHPNLYGISFAPEPFSSLGLVVCIADGQLLQWTVQVAKPKRQGDGAAPSSHDEMGVSAVDVVRDLSGPPVLSVEMSTATGLFEQAVLRDDDDEDDDDIEADVYRSKHLAITALTTQQQHKDHRAHPTDIARLTIMGSVCVITQRPLDADWDASDVMLVTNTLGIDKNAAAVELHEGGNEEVAGAATTPRSTPEFHSVPFPTQSLHMQEVVAAPYASLRRGGGGGNSFSNSDASPLGEKPAGTGGRGTPAWETEVCNLACRDDDGNIFLVTVPTADALTDEIVRGTSAHNGSFNRSGDFSMVPQRIYKSKFNRFSCMAISPDGNSVACGLRNGSVEVFRRGCTDMQREFHDHADAIASVCFIDNLHIAVSGYDGVLTVVDVRVGVNDKSELSPGIAYRKMLLFPDGNRLACISENHEVHVHNVGAMLSQSDDHASVPLTMSSCRPDNTVAVAVFNGVDRVEIREVLVDGSKFPAHSSGMSNEASRVTFSGYLPARSVYLNPSGSILVVLCRDGSIVSYSLVTSHSRAGTAAADQQHTVRSLDASRQLGHRKRGPFHAMESVTLNAEGSVALDRHQSLRSHLARSSTVVTVAVEKRDHSYRLHLFQIELPNHAKSLRNIRKSIQEEQRRAGGANVVMNKIDLAEHLFSSEGRAGAANDVPLTAVAFTADATKLCLWIGADVFVCDVDTVKKTMQVLCVLHPSPLLKEEKIFQYSIRLKATGGALQVDHRHGGRVLRIIEHDQHFYVEEWHNVFKERDPESVWLVDTQAKYIRFRSNLDVQNANPTPTPQAKAAQGEEALPHSPLVSNNKSHGMEDTPLSTGNNALPQLSGDSDGIPLGVPVALQGVTATDTTSEASLPSPRVALDPEALCLPAEHQVQHSLPHLLEVYGYPKSKDPMQHAIRRGMNTLFPLLRTDELAQNSITAMLLPRGEGVITTAMCGTAFWPRESHTGKNVTFEVSKFIVDMFQPSEFLVLKAVVATLLGLISAFNLVVNFDKYPIGHWTRFAMFCASLCNGPIYSSVIDPISALTVHLHLQRSGLFPVAGGARATWQHLYADRNSFHKAYLSVGGGVFLLIMIFWFPGFTAVGPFFGSILIVCAILNIIVRLAINSPLISVSNATANAACHRQFLAYLRHCLLFLLCLIDNININFFLQAIIRFPVNTGVILFGGAPYPLYPYVKSQTVGPDMGLFLNATYGYDGFNIPEIPYASMSGAAVAHAPFYMIQLSSGSCNAVRFASSFLMQLDTIFLFM